jgi:hypothetical protein
MNQSNNQLEKERATKVQVFAHLPLCIDALEASNIPKKLSYEDDFSEIFAQPNRS